MVGQLYNLGRSGGVVVFFAGLKLRCHFIGGDFLIYRHINNIDIICTSKCGRQIYK